MIKYNKIYWFFQRQLLSADPVNNCILLYMYTYFFTVLFIKPSQNIFFW